MALKDRIKETYVNVTLCDDGCVNTGIDVKSNVATCDCKFNEITNNDLIHENAALEYLVGEIFDLVNSSNILVLKCYKYLLKYFTRSMRNYPNNIISFIPNFCRRILFIRTYQNEKIHIFLNRKIHFIFGQIWKYF